MGFHSLTILVYRMQLPEHSLSEDTHDAHAFFQGQQHDVYIGCIHRVTLFPFLERLEEEHKRDGAPLEICVIQQQGILFGELSSGGFTCGSC